MGQHTDGGADPAGAREGSGPPCWAQPHGYERFMGRWSRAIAARFLPALGVPSGRRWLDVGCGTGALTRAIVEGCRPSLVTGVDPSAAFLQHAEASMPPAAPVALRQGRAEDLPLPSASVDATVSGLALNFADQPGMALREMARVTRPGGVVAAYVWQYDHPDFFLNRFWEAVARSDEDGPTENERARWAMCAPAGLRALAEPVLHDVRIWHIEIPTVFSSAEELWDGFLLGVGPAGAWTARLDPDRRARLRTQLEASLPVAPDGTVPLSARALAVAGAAPRAS